MLIRCKTGGEMIEVPEGQDPHAALDAAGCSHCKDGHGPDTNCGQASQVCADNPDSHPGPCWTGDGDRPDGCTVCRPIIHLAGTTGLNLAG